MKRTIAVSLAVLMTLLLIACDNNSVSDGMPETAIRVPPGMYFPKDKEAFLTLDDGTMIDALFFPDSARILMSIKDAPPDAIEGNYSIEDGILRVRRHSIDFHMYENSVFLNGVEFILGTANDEPGESDNPGHVSLDLSAPVHNGNNSVNRGFAAETADFIYFSFGDPGLFRMNHDGSGIVKLNDDVARYINISDGWIYYQKCNGDPGMYKVRTDGSQRTRITDGYFENIIIYDDWIYYIDRESPLDMGEIYRMSLDGASVSIVTDWGENVEFFVISFDEIFIVGSGAIFRTDLDGNIPDGAFDDDVYRGLRVVSLNATDDPHEPIVFGVDYIDDSIFALSAFYDLADDMNHVRRLVFDANRTSGIVYHNGYLYHNKNDSLYRMTLDGSEDRLLYEGNIVSFNVVGDKIFFWAVYELPLFFVMNTDGTGITPLLTPPSEASDYRYTGDDDFVFLVHSSFPYSIDDIWDDYYVTNFRFTVGIDYGFLKQVLDEFDNHWIIDTRVFSGNEQVLMALRNGEIDMAWLPEGFYQSYPDKSDLSVLFG